MTGTSTKTFGSLLGARFRLTPEGGDSAMSALSGSSDFVIGAHAEQRGYTLLTLDDRIYRAAFPNLAIVGV